MFRVSRAEEQAVRLSMRLAAVGDQMTLAELARSESMPEPTVAKLLNLLRRGGVVEAVRGRHGGYVLAGRPEQVSAGKVIRSVGGDSVFGYPCDSPDATPDCVRNDDCGLRPVWRHLESRVTEVLEQTTLADLLQREAEAANQLQNLWPLGES